VIAIFEVDVAKSLRVAIPPLAFKDTSFEEERPMTFSLAIVPLPGVGCPVATTKHAEAFPLANWIPEAQVLVVELIQLPLKRLALWMTMDRCFVHLVTASMACM